MTKYVRRSRVRGSPQPAWSIPRCAQGWAEGVASPRRRGKTRGSTMNTSDHRNGRPVLSWDEWEEGAHFAVRVPAGPTEYRLVLDRNGPHSIAGTDARDHVWGQGGGDAIGGGAEDDVIDGGDGDDLLSGNDGMD